MADPLVGRAEPKRQSTLSEGGSAVGGLILGIGFAALMLANNDSGEAFSDSPQMVALAALVCLPGTLCLMAGRRRPSLYLAGSMIGGLIPMLLGSVVGIGFWLPAGLALVAYGRRAGSARGRLADPVIAFVCFALAFAAIGAMFVHQDPGCVYRINSSTCTSDYVTRTEGLISLTITVLTPIAAWTLSRPGSEPGGSTVAPR